MKAANPMVILNNVSGLSKTSMVSGDVRFIRKLFPLLNSRSSAL